MTFFITLTSIWAMSIFNVNCVQTSCTQTASPQPSSRLSSPAFSTVSFLSSHLLVPPASFQLLHVPHPSIFSLVVLSSSFHFRVPASNNQLNRLELQFSGEL